MHDKQIIEKLISESNFDEAIKRLDQEIIKNPEDASLWYMRGRAYWAKQDMKSAICDYQEAAHLDPASPAVQALEMADSILNFYNPDLLNP